MSEPALLDAGELGALIPALSDPWKTVFVDAANSWISRKAPAVLDDAGAKAEAKLIVVRAIQRVSNSKEWVSAQSAGPFSISYVTGGRGLFDEGDRAALLDLVPAVGGALPSGSFPPARDYERLYSMPPGGPLDVRRW